MADWWKADDGWSLQSLSRWQSATTSITATRSRPKHSQLDTISPPLDSVQWLVHYSATRHTVHVVWGPCSSTKPYHPRRTASCQSTHATTQCSLGATASWWVERYSAESGQQQSQSSTLKSSRDCNAAVPRSTNTRGTYPSWPHWVHNAIVSTRSTVHMVTRMACAHKWPLCIGSKMKCHRQVYWKLQLIDDSKTQH